MKIHFTRLFDNRDLVECASMATDPFDGNILALDENGFLIMSIKPEYVAIIESNGKESKD